jgi:hypothetical protein
VGFAWDLRVPQTRNLDALHRKARTKKEWDRLGEDERLGLEWEQFRATSRYKAIYAAPLFDRSPGSAEPKIKGILAIDVLRPDRFNELKAATRPNPAFASVVGLCETGLGPLRGIS